MCILSQDRQEHNRANGATKLTRSRLDDLLCTKDYWASPRVSPILPTLLHVSEAFDRPAASIAPYPPPPHPTRGPVPPSIAAYMARQPLLAHLSRITYQCPSPLLFGTYPWITPGHSCQFSIEAVDGAGPIRAPLTRTLLPSRLTNPPSIT